MQDFKQVKISELFDMLAQKTAHYMKMLSGGATKAEFNSCRDTIIDIQLEIQSRKPSKTNISTPDISLPQDRSPIEQRKG